MARDRAIVQGNERLESGVEHQFDGVRQLVEHSVVDDLGRRCDTPPRHIHAVAHHTEGSKRGEGRGCGRRRIDRRVELRTDPEAERCEG
ncbi:MAG: hypothetical protein R2710_03685 [Acidimicrobiales bacterium]